MVKTIKIKCPHCNEESELFLSINPTVIVLNCPDCWTPLMYDRFEVRVLSEQDISAIAPASAHTETSVVEDKIGEAVAKRKKYTQRESEKSYSHEKPPLIVVSEGEEAIDEKENISVDDVLDLRIELSACEDVLEFINRI